MQKPIGKLLLGCCYLSEIKKLMDMRNKLRHPESEQSNEVEVLAVVGEQLEKKKTKRT